MSTKLRKSNSNKMMSGTLGGIGEAIDIDPAIIRIGFCLFTIFTGFLLGLLIYWILYICIPAEPQW